jgi:hypothetical protein
MGNSVGTQELDSSPAPGKFPISRVSESDAAKKDRSFPDLTKLRIFENISRGSDSFVAKKSVDEEVA